MPGFSAKTDQTDQTDLTENKSTSFTIERSFKSSFQFDVASITSTSSLITGTTKDILNQSGSILDFYSKSGNANPAEPLKLAVGQDLDQKLAKILNQFDWVIKNSDAFLQDPSMQKELIANSRDLVQLLKAGQGQLIGPESQTKQLELTAELLQRHVNLNKRLNISLEKLGQADLSSSFESSLEVFDYSSQVDFYSQRFTQELSQTRTDSKEKLLFFTQSQQTEPKIDPTDITIKPAPSPDPPVDPVQTPFKLQPKDPKSVTRVQGDEFADKALEMFGKLDTDNDGFISNNEISAAVMDHRYVGEEAQIIAGLAAGREHIQGCTDNEWGFENDGITKQDLIKLRDIQKTVENDIYPISSARNEERFKRFDADGDGFITKTEINTALLNSKPNSYDREVLKALKNKYDTLSGASNDQWGFEDGISKEDINKFLETDKDLNLISNIESAKNSTANGQSSEISPELYVNGDPSKAITPEAIKQGRIGDCYFLAALGAVASHNPESIQKMITDNKDGTYTVTFPGDKEHPVTVKGPTEAELGLYNGSAKNGIWANVLEKAYGQYRWNQDSVRRDEGINGNTQTDGADNGGRPEKVLELLTGRSTDVDENYWTRNSVALEKLTKAFSSNPPLPVTACMGNEDKNGFPGNHAYGVLDFKPDGKGGGTVTIMNPWGGEKGTTSGTVTMPLKDFLSTFNDIQYTEK